MCAVTCYLESLFHEFKYAEYLMFIKKAEDRIKDSCSYGQTIAFLHSDVFWDKGKNFYKDDYDLFVEYFEVQGFKVRNGGDGCLSISWDLDKKGGKNELS